MRLIRSLILLGILPLAATVLAAQVHIGSAGAKIELMHHAKTKGWVNLNASPRAHFTSARLGDYLVFRAYEIHVDDPAALGVTLFYEPSDLLGDEATIRLFRKNPDHSWTEQRAVLDADRNCIILGRLPASGTYGIGYRFDRTEHTLRVRLIDRDSGRPLGGARVRIWTRPNVPNRGCFFYLTADERGGVTIRLPRVKCWIKPSAHGLVRWHEGPTEPFLLDGDMTRTVKMFPGHTVRGIVVDEEGKPVANATVRNETVGPSGVFVLGGLSNRTQDIWAELLVPWERSIGGDGGMILWTDKRLLGLGHATLDPTSGEVEIRMRPVGRLVPESPPEFDRTPWAMPLEEGCLVRMASPRGSFFVSLEEFVQNEGAWLPAGEYRVTVTTPKTATDLGTVTIRGAKETKLDMKTALPERERWRFKFQPSHSSIPTLAPQAYISWQIPNAWSLAKRLQKDGR